MQGCIMMLPIVYLLLLSSVACTSNRKLKLASTEDEVYKHHEYNCEPREVHLSLSESTDELRVVWTTSAEGCGASVNYGRTDFASQLSNSSESVRNKTLLTQWAHGTSYVLTNRHMCSGKARNKKEFEKIFHTSLLSNLETQAVYQYRITGSDETYTFVANPAKGKKARMNFVMFGDMGESEYRADKNPMADETLEAILREHESMPLDLLVHVGDLAYADGKIKSWGAFMDMIEPLAAEVPYMVAIGNHEYGYSYEDSSDSDNDPSGVSEPYQPYWGNFGDDSRGECGAATARHFLMPSGASNKKAKQRDPPFYELEGEQGALFSETTVQHRHHHRSLLANKRDSMNSAVGEDDPAVHAEIRGGAESAEGDVEYYSPTDNPPFWYSFDYGIVHFTVVSTEHDLSPGSLQYDWLQADLASVDRCATPWLLVGMHRPMYVVYPHKSNRDVGEHLQDFLEDLLLEYQVDAVVSGHVHSYYRTCSVDKERCTDDNSGIVHLVMGTGGHVLSDVEDEQRMWCLSAAVEHGFGSFQVHGEHMRFSFISSRDSRVLDETKLWAKVTSNSCDDYMKTRRLAGVQRPPDYDAARQRKRDEEEADARERGSGSEEGSGAAAAAGSTSAAKHHIDGEGLVPAGTLPAEVETDEPSE